MTGSVGSVQSGSALETTGASQPTNHRAGQLQSAKLIVSGTPYSGASVVGQALVDASVVLPGLVGTPGANDAVGMFIHRTMAALHNEMLAAAATSWLGPVSGALRPNEDHRRRARSLLDVENGTTPGWAFVDPRTALFTGLWDEIVPDARWIFVVRSPAHTAWVMLRRRSFADEPSPRRRVQRALEVWNWYATNIAEFCSRHVDRTALLFAPDDLCPTGDAHIAALTDGLVPTTLGRAYHPLLLRNASPRWVRLHSGLDRAAATTMAALRDVRHRQLMTRGLGERHALSRPAVTPERRPVICLASRRRFPVSETFIRDHLRHLPASRWLVGGRGDVKRDENDLPVGSMLERFLASGLTELGHTGTRIETRGLARYLRREGVSVVLAEFGPVAVEYIDACQSARVPLVAHFHGYDAWKRGVLAEYGGAYRRLFAAAGALVVVSRDMARQLESLGAPADRIVWSPCGVDTNTFAGAVPERSGPVFISVGRFVEKKAPQNVLLAFAHLATRRPEASLVMIGDGAMLEPCRLLCDALGLGSRVEFTGVLAPARVAAEMRSARAFIQHSIIDGEGNAEGTPVSVLEAGSSGLAVVATRHMGIADVVVHGDTGFLVDEGDIRAMGEHLVTLCDDPELAGSMGRRARERISAEFSMERSIERLRGAIELAIHNGPSNVAPRA